MKKPKAEKLIISVLAAAIITAACGLGLLNAVDYFFSDMLYQHEQAADGEIVIIQMDEAALDYIGQMPWKRSVYADIINFLNSNGCAPAAIGVDVIFAGHSADPADDEALAEACRNAGNVVVAGAAVFGYDIIVIGDSFFVDDRAVISWDGPFEALAAAARVGCINAMADEDGNLRHVLYHVKVPGKLIDYSPESEASSDMISFKTMPRILYEMYCEYTGEEYNTPSIKGRDTFWYLPYTGRGGAYSDNISAADIFNGDIEPEFFDGKIVLIGPYAAGLQDEYRTSIDHADTMFGIEIQANQIDAYRNGFFPVEVSKGLQLACVFVISAAALFFLLDNSVRNSIFIWLGISAVWTGASLLLYKAGHILHVSWVPAAATILFIAAVAVNYIRAAAEKKKVTETFGKYVDPTVLNQLLRTDQDSLALGGKSYDIAVLFVDIRGFTTMSESLEPETVVEILNKYLTLTTECVMKNHGTLDKFVGDCTMAFWNAPLPQEDPVYLACCAAMDMVEGAKTLGKELEEKYGRTVGFGVGVHYGPAVVGNIGAAKRMDYTAIGDTVNTSSRLESNAPAGTVYISRIVADALGSRAKTTSLGGSIKLKGKAEGFEVLTLDSLER